MNIKYNIYNPTTGIINKTIDLDLDMDPTGLTRNIETEEEVYVGDINTDTHYLPNGVFTPRPVFPGWWNKTIFRADHVDSATLTGIPTNTEIHIITPEGVDNLAITVTDGVLNIMCSAIGINMVYITPPYPYISTTTEIRSS